jgi:hypothetical protein
MIKYVHKIHFECIIQWLEARGMSAKGSENLPCVGYVALSEAKPVAIAFLRICEGSLAIIEGLTTNPEAPSAVRHNAINDLIMQLINDAKMLGVKQLLSYSIDGDTIKRSESYGFKLLPHSLIGMDLGE